MSHEYESITDEVLVKSVQDAGSGDLRAFEELVERHRGRILANCRYMTRSPDDAEDLAQEVFARAFFGLKNFRGQAAFGTWLQRIKVNHCLNFLKKRGRQPERVDADAPTVQAHEAMRREPRAERRVAASEEGKRIEVVLDSMSETLRVPLLMRDLDDFSYQEIAEELGIGLSATKMRIKRAREEFRGRYQELTGAEMPTRAGSGADGNGRSREGNERG
jgi:RNA polymerase sigma-70 factor (ECF subfamily)